MCGEKVGDPVPSSEADGWEPTDERESSREGVGMEYSPPAPRELTADDVAADFAAHMTRFDLGLLLWGGGYVATMGALDDVLDAWKGSRTSLLARLEEECPPEPLSAREVAEYYSAIISRAKIENLLCWGNFAATTSPPLPLIRSWMSFSRSF